MPPLRLAELGGEALPVGNLRASVGGGLLLGVAAGEGIAVGVLELVGEVFDDLLLALGVQSGQRQMPANVLDPIRRGGFLPPG